MKFYSGLLKFVFVVNLFVVFFASCKKSDTQNNNVPATIVDFTININAPGYTSLTAVGGWVYVTGGNKGIVVYRKSNTEFMAYDRTCTYDPSASCARIIVDSSGLQAADTCCNSKFLLTDGNIINGPATVPLKQYNTYFDGSQNLRVYSQ